MKTSYNLVCSCGHVGELILKENDQPFSGNWEKYSLIGFEGETFQTTQHTSFGEALKKMRATCPECSKQITVDNIQ